MDKMTLEQGFLRVLRFSLVSIILPMLQTHLHVQVALTRKINGAKPGNISKNNALAEIGKYWIQNDFRLLNLILVFNLSKLSGNFTYHQV
jgi:hypothetical protein